MRKSFLPAQCRSRLRSEPRTRTQRLVRGEGGGSAPSPAVCQSNTTTKTHTMIVRVEPPSPQQPHGHAVDTNQYNRRQHIALMHRLEKDKRDVTRPARIQRDGAPHHRSARCMGWLPQAATSSPSLPSPAVPGPCVEATLPWPYARGTQGTINSARGPGCVNFCQCQKNNRNLHNAPKRQTQDLSVIYYDCGPL